MSLLPSEIRQLPIADRLVLVEELWDSIAADEDQLSLTEAQKSVLDSRLGARRDRDDASSAWSEVKRRILGR
jgi:putative addiction module component (TIGR02574 family)